MNILLLGGSIFLGRHIALAAIQSGHTVTFFNRGIHYPDDFPHIEKIRGDRTTDIHLLQRRKWDAVIDTCGYVPRIVNISAQYLSDLSDNYVFISSVSVYSDVTGHLDENAPVLQIVDTTTEEISGETYGALKFLCEQTCEKHFKGRVLTIRPGLIVGPNDWSGRFNYWVHRIRLGGTILIPNAFDLTTQFIDVRDLAEWIVRLIEKKTTGVFNADGDTNITFKDVLESCYQIAQSEVSFIPVSEFFLKEHNVQPYSELPLWIPEEYGNRTFSTSKAINLGLTHRTLSDSVLQAADWLSTIDPLTSALGKSMTHQREQELLEIWSKEWQ
ncbi:MAG: NAD-dependent epimerase/dehydratase family protein [Ignavibacteria bacterium]|nr:NAD-dependent epimerase/dehydratase family protein [Ignavibacteria bacterium]